jgi:hypothetical protein
VGSNGRKTIRKPVRFHAIGAVQERYKFPGYLCISIASLHGFALRPLPCNYNVLEFVCALSRRKRGFKSRRGRHFSMTCVQRPLGSRETNFPCTANTLASTSGHVIHWLTAKIHEIATKRTKGIKEFAFRQRWKRSRKCVCNSTVKSGICLIKETTGGRR